MQRFTKYKAVINPLGAVHAGRPHSGEGDFVQCGQGVLQMRTSAFLMQKTSDFSKFMMCPHGQGGLEPVRTGRRRVIFFAI